MAETSNLIVRSAPADKRKSGDSAKRRGIARGKMQVESDGDAGADEIEEEMNYEEDDAHQQFVDNLHVGASASESEDGTFSFFMENKHTQRKTDTDMRTLISYLESINESRPPEIIPPVQLDNYLSNFFLVVRKADGSEYEPKTLRAIMASIERYLRCKSYLVSITRDYLFTKTRESLKEKQRMLKEQGFGAKPRPPMDPLGVGVAQKVSLLYAKEKMGPYNPISLISTLMFLFIVHFRLRKAVDHKNLLWGDIQLKVDKNGREYLVYRPQSLPSMPMHIEHFRQTFNIWAQPEKPERDPVSLYHLYAEKRPLSMKYSNSPFYLGIYSMNPLPFQEWYRTSPMGINKLCDLVKQIRSITGLPRAMYSPDSTLVNPQFISNALVGMEPTNVEEESVNEIIKQNNMQSADAEEFRVDSDIESVNDQQSNTSLVGSLENQSSIELEENNPDLEIIEEKREIVEEPISLMPAADLFLGLDAAKDQFSTMLQKMDIDDLVAFDKWLKLMRISRDPATGKVICRENANQQPAAVNSNLQTERDFSLPTINNVYGSLPNTNISVKITLSPQALLGQGPITVTANMHSDQKTGGNTASLTSPSQSDSDHCRIEERAPCKRSMSPSKSRASRLSHAPVQTSLALNNQNAFPVHLIPNSSSQEGTNMKKTRLDAYSCGNTQSSQAAIKRFSKVAGSSKLLTSGDVLPSMQSPRNTQKLVSIRPKMSAPPPTFSSLSMASRCSPQNPSVIFIKQDPD